MKNLKENRLGEECFNNNGTLYKIIKYDRRENIVVESQDEYRYAIKTTYSHFKKGVIINPFEKTVNGVGYLGEGHYLTSINGKNTEQFNSWKRMINRCYNDNTLSKAPTYKECIVNDEWHNFQNFAEWYENNYYEIPNETMCLDKDILIKGNKVYSSENCAFVPKEINNLFTKTNAKRGKYPIGVSFKNSINKYVAQCHYLGNEQYLGSYNSIIEAFNVYKKYKENIIKETANKYKQYIPEKLYNAMVNYIVEITD